MFFSPLKKIKNLFLTQTSPMCFNIIRFRRSNLKAVSSFLSLATCSCTLLIWGTSIFLSPRTFPGRAFSHPQYKSGYSVFKYFFQLININLLFCFLKNFCQKTHLQNLIFQKLFLASGGFSGLIKYLYLIMASKIAVCL